MKLDHWFAQANFFTQPSLTKMELLLAQRQALFQRQHELLQRQAVLTQRQHELCEQRTVHELQSRLFWLKLRRAAIEQRDEAYLN
jgi:hypothetical protein